MGNFSVFKGVDNEVEFKGLRGQYIYYGLAGVGGTCVLVLILFAIGIPILVVIALFIVGNGYTINRVITHNKKYGKWGKVKEQVGKAKPEYVFQRKTFFRIIEAQPLMPPFERKSPK